ncbi:hypothetical protein QUF61_13140 [Candidatus Venteria ishoeyi]|uniref:hypothetical protein n=1 Tax=Candidatus Venteria ishoeyi TaxID=1899563 RepID=UPI0025A5AA4D|nr:hypothetical protein [Candidatus Venteria ishoeyi]MDM8547434.1 hypothetical protein [Candidatus Venteria ishoeyi]
MLHNRNIVKMKKLIPEKTVLLSKTQWAAKLTQEKLVHEWPQSIIDMVGTWEDFPDIEDIRSQQEQDVEREHL